MRLLWILVIVSVLSLSFTNVQLSEAQGSCRLGDWHVWSLPTNARAGQNDDFRYNTSTHRPDPGWTIIDFEIETISRYGRTDSSIQNLQPNSTLISASEYSRVQEDLVDARANYQGSQGAEEANFFFNSYFSNFEQSYFAVSSSHRAIQWTVGAAGEGWPNGGGSYQSNLVVLELCVGGNPELVTQQLRAAMEARVQGRFPRIGTFEPIEEPVLMVCIQNETGSDFTYRLRGTNGQYRSEASEIGRDRTSFWTVPTSLARLANSSSQDNHLAMRFDSSYSDGFQERVISLDTYPTPIHDCRELPYQIVVVREGNDIDVQRWRTSDYFETFVYR